MDQVRFAGTIGRWNLIDLVKYTSRLRNPAQVAQARKAHIRGAQVAGCISGIGERAREIRSSELYRSLRAP